MANWFVQTLRTYPEIAIFLSLAAGYYFGSFTYKGLGLGAVTATLIAAVIIGQIGITISGPLKPSTRRRTSVSRYASGSERSSASACFASALCSGL